MLKYDPKEYLKLKWLRRRYSHRALATADYQYRILKVRYDNGKFMFDVRRKYIGECDFSMRQITFEMEYYFGIRNHMFFINTI
jgi:hypothetical protein